MKEKFIADRITQLRMEKDISEYKLSYALGQSKSYINMITTGRANISVPGLLAICDYFGITPAEFFAPEFNEDVRNLVKEFNCLNDENKAVIKKTMEAFLCVQKEGKNVGSADDKKMKE